MALVTRVTKRGFIWIPRPFTPEFMVKQEIIKNGVTYNVASRMRYLEFSKSIQLEVGKFKIILDNNADEYTDLFTGGETVRFYLDMSDGTTMAFQGFIEEVKNVYSERGYELEITGSHDAGKLLEITVTYSATDLAIEEIMEDLVTTYASDFTYNKAVYPCDTTATVNWSHKPFWECITDLCNLATYDCYVDDNKAFHFFAENSIECVLDAIVFADNVIDIEGLGKDTIDIKNKVIVYGEDDKGLPVVYTSEDTGSETSYGTKEKIIKDGNIKTMEQAQERADAELALLKETKLKGKTKSWGMVYLNPGEKIWISIPPQKIHGQYKILKFTQFIDREGLFKTECEIQAPVKGISQFFKERLKTELAHEKIENPNKLKFSYNFTFDDYTNIDSHTNTEISEGRLQLQSGQTSGTITTSTKVTSANFTNVELRYIGQDLLSSSFQVSSDNGITWKTITKEVLNAVPSGKYMKIIINLVQDANNLAPQIESLALLYS